jgi:hypothetical protein
MLYITYVYFSNPVWTSLSPSDSSCSILSFHLYHVWGQSLLYTSLKIWIVD